MARLIRHWSLDLFVDDEQAHLFGEDSPTPVFRADPRCGRLAEEEGTQLRFEFETGLARLKAACAPLARRESARCGGAPHPDPLPASGEREQSAQATLKVN